MLSDLPSLDAIRYFEASARLLSFTKAGEELFVSQSAISQQVISLESYLGFKLFNRGSRQLTLTREGKKLYEASQKALGLISGALNSIQTQTLAGTLTLVAAPSIVSKWLLPRLPRFYLEHPEVELNIAVKIEMANPSVWIPHFRSYNADIAICFENVPSKELSYIYLFDDSLYPVCSPDFQKKNKVRHPSDLSNLPILKDSNQQDFFTCNWNEWLEKSGHQGTEIGQGYSFNHLDLMIQAAINGQGVALARRSLVEDDIKEGRLVKLFEETPSGAFYLAVLKDHEENSRVKVFVKWLKSELNEASDNGEM